MTPNLKRAPSRPPMSEEEEDRLDAEDGLAALAEFEASGEKAIPLEEVLAGHGLTIADLSD